MTRYYVEGVNAFTSGIKFGPFNTIEEARTFLNSCVYLSDQKKQEWLHENCIHEIKEGEVIGGQKF